MQVACPVCGSRDLSELARIPGVPVFCNVLARSRTEALSAARGNIRLLHCLRCTHSFNVEFDPAKTEYTGAYENSLHFSPRFNRYAESLARRLIETHDVKDKDVVEVGCGDGRFLDIICRMGGNRGLGFDRAHRRSEEGAPGAAELSSRVEVRDQYLTPEHPGVPVDLLVCRHVLEHLQDPAGFMEGLGRWLGSGSRAVLYLEVPNVRYTLEEGGIWDLIYEHPSYFSRESLARLLRRSGFSVLDSGEDFGGQYLFATARLASAPETGKRSPGPGVTPQGFGVRSPGPDASAPGGSVGMFSGFLQETVERWKELLAESARRGEQLALWGAGSKGVTFLNLLNPGSTMAWVVDLSPRKQGRFVPGTGHRVVAPEALVQKDPRAVVVMNGQYEEEIVEHLRTLDIQAPCWLASAL